MQFSIDEWAAVTLTHVSKRTETHGAEKKHAMDLAWRMECPNGILDKFPGNVREQLFYGDPNTDIPGVVATTPHLRITSFEGPFKMPYEGTGYLLTIEDGAISGSKFELGGSELGKVTVAPKDGGSIILTFRTQHVGLDQATMGRILIMDGKQVRMLAAPPSMQEGTQPERLTKAQQKARAKADAEAAFNKPLPLTGGAGVDPEAPTAGDAFAEKVAAGETTPAKAKHPVATSKPSLKVVGRGKTRSGKGG